MQLFLAISPQSTEVPLHKREDLIFEYVATCIAPIVDSLLLVISTMVAALWMCNWKVYIILIEDIWSLETQPLFTPNVT